MNKWHPIGKEKVKLSLFAGNIICRKPLRLHLKKKLLELINEFNKVAGFTVNTKKSIAFLYPNNEQL